MMMMMMMMTMMMMMMMVVAEVVREVGRKECFVEDMECSAFHGMQRRHPRVFFLRAYSGSVMLRSAIACVSESRGRERGARCTLTSRTSFSICIARDAITAVSPFAHHTSQSHEVTKSQCHEVTLSQGQSHKVTMSVVAGIPP
eukprot:2541751-Rhodomonas_salina.1